MTDIQEYGETVFSQLLRRAQTAKEREEMLSLKSALLARFQQDTICPDCQEPQRPTYHGMVCVNAAKYGQILLFQHNGVKTGFREFSRLNA
jgi:hypothetical protein